VIDRARGVFARSGADKEVVLALAVLAELEPDRRDQRWAEIDEVLSFADEQAVLQNGELAVRAAPIDILEPVALALPVPIVTDRYVALAVARQAAVADSLDRSGATFDAVRAQQGVLHAARAVAAVLARAGRAGDIATRIGPMRG